jgi:hypothetical protein
MFRFLIFCGAFTKGLLFHFFSLLFLGPYLHPKISSGADGQVQTQPYPIWPKRLVLEKMPPTPPCDPSIDAKHPPGFRSASGRGYYLLPICPIKSDAIDIKNVEEFHFQNQSSSR